MSTIIEGFTLDSFNFYKDEKKFYPVICPDISDYNSSYNTCCIDVDLSKSSNLDFSKPLKEAEKIVSLGGYILWNIHFHLIEDHIDLHFEGHFNILNRGFTAFLEKLVSPFLKNSLGVCLFDNTIDCVDYLSFNATFEDYFAEWLSDEFPENQHIDDLVFQNHLKRVFLINTLSEYLHRFSARVFDEMISFVSFDTKSIPDQAKLFQMLSKKRFNHIKLILSNHETPLGHITKDRGFPSFGYMGDVKNLLKETTAPTLGICFPEDSMCNPKILKTLNQIFERLNSLNVSYRIFPEYNGMHDWDQLEQIIVISETLTTLGKRVLQGFCAAMGQVIYYGEKLEFLDEKSFEDYLKDISG